MLALSAHPSRSTRIVELNTEMLDSMFRECYSALALAFPRPMAALTEEGFVNAMRLITAKRVSWVREKALGVPDSDVPRLSINPTTPVFGPLFVMLANIGVVESESHGVRFIPGYQNIKEWFSIDRGVIRTYVQVMLAIKGPAIISDGMPSSEKGTFAFVNLVELDNRGVTSRAPSREATADEHLMASIVFQNVRALEAMSYEWYSRTVADPALALTEFVGSYIKRGGYTDAIL
jgi:hypothetical protein